MAEGGRAQDAKGAGDARPRTVVVIDDDGAMLSLIEQMLEPAGYRVVCTTDPTRGVELIRQMKPDVVLCDIVMPGKDGYAVYQALQDGKEPACRAFLFLTAHAELTERVRAFRAGVVDFMSKPFTQTVLLRKIERLLSRHPAAANAAQRTILPETAGAKPGRLEVDFGSLPSELRRVLIVDDDDAYRQMLRSVLQPRGFAVMEASDGHAALRAALEHRPWLVLADVNMPAMDGYELCRRFRSHALLRSLPFIFLSGRDTFSDRSMGYEAGADEYLAKMTPVRELLIRIRLVLQRLATGWMRAGTAIEGELGVIGPAGVLQICHLSKVSGVFTVRTGDEEVEIRFRDGEVVAATWGEVSGPDAVFEFLSWTSGRFEFRPGDPGPGSAFPKTISEMVLEGYRRMDESSQ